MLDYPSAEHQISQALTKCGFACSRVEWAVMGRPDLVPLLVTVQKDPSGADRRISPADRTIEANSDRAAADRGTADPFWALADLLGATITHAADGLKTDSGLRKAVSWAVAALATAHALRESEPVSGILDVIAKLQAAGDYETADLVQTYSTRQGTPDVSASKPFVRAIIIICSATLVGGGIAAPLAAIATGQGVAEAVIVGALTSVLTGTGAEVTLAILNTNPATASGTSPVEATPSAAGIEARRVLRTPAPAAGHTDRQATPPTTNLRAPKSPVRPTWWQQPPGSNPPNPPTSSI